jgi:hypothetical protein
MKAKYLSKSKTWKLSNGWRAQTSYTWHGIPFISKLTSPDKKQYWHCSSGLDFRETYADLEEVIEVFEGLGQIPLPDFAQPFVGKVKGFDGKPIERLVAVFFTRNA